MLAASLFLAFEDLQKKLWGAGSGEVLSSDAWLGEAVLTMELLDNNATPLC